MDLALSPEQAALRDLAREIVAARCTDDRLRALEAEGRGFDPDLWAELARANLLGAGIPEDVGGIGGGIIEVCVVVEEAGRVVAPVPLWPALAGARALARAGEADVLGAAVTGGPPVIPALMEPAARDPYLVEARRSADGVTGVKTLVPHAAEAARLIVPARGDDAPVLTLVDPRDASLAEQVPVGGATTAQVTLDETPAVSLAGEHGRLVDEAILALCAWQLGMAERALELTATYTSEREQFGKPIGAFQAVQQRIADAYIDVQAMRWTLWEAAWRLSEDLPARDHVRTAKVWAGEGAARVLAAAQHLHGGIGVDTDYPLHRFTFASRHAALALGTPDAHLEAIGGSLA